MAESKLAYRAYWRKDGQPEQLVTILQGKIGGRGSTKIRNQFGFKDTVPSNQLFEIDAGERTASFRVG